MKSENELPHGQNESDLQIGLDSLDEWQSLVHRYRTREEEAYGPALKLVLSELIELSYTGARAVEKYLELFHTQDLESESSESKVLSPDLPEWRPGRASRSDDDA